MTLSAAPGGVALPALLATRSNEVKPSARKANGTARAATARTGHRVSFVLPAYNEEGNILRAIDSTVAAASRYCGQYEVIVVDDGSRDRTAELVERASAENKSIRLVRHTTNRGYGDALRTGFASATLDFVFFTDADKLARLEGVEDPVIGGRRDQRRVIVRAPCGGTVVR